MSPPRADAAARLQARRESLIAAAYKLILDKGYSRVGVADIVAEAGVSHGTFYNYFDNVRDILDSVIDFGFARVSESLLPSEEPVDSIDGFVDRWNVVLSRLAKLPVEQPSLANFLMFEAAAIDEAVARKLVTEYRRFGAQTAEIIRGSVDAGILRQDLDTAMMAEAIVAMFTGCVFPMVYDSGVIDSERLATAAVDLIRRGMGNAE